MENSCFNNLRNIACFVSDLSDNEIENVKKILSDKEKKLYDLCIKEFHHKNSDKIATDRVAIENLVVGLLDSTGAQQEVSTLLGSLIDKIQSNIPSSIMGKRKAELAIDFSDVKETSEVFDDYLHRIFLTTNESIAGHGQILQQLQQIPIRGISDEKMKTHKTVIAVSGFCGLNMACARGNANPSKQDIDTIIILDRSSKVETFWKAMEKIILTSNTKEDVLKALESLVKENEMFKLKEFPDEDPLVLEKALHYAPMKFLNKEIMNKISWLSDEKKFQKIKNIFSNNRFIFKRLDFANPNALSSLKKALDDNHCTVDLLYVSNISEYVGSNEKEFETYKQGILDLLEENSLFIDSITSHEKNGIVPRLFQSPKDEVDIWGAIPERVIPK